MQPRAGSAVPDGMTDSKETAGQSRQNMTGKDTTPPDGMPGERAGLPEGSLPTPFLGPQGDENRPPPANAPAPVNPTATVPEAGKQRK